jgi:hypothetical protein
MTSFTCASAKRRPMQWCAPPPKGIQWWLCRSSVARLGSKRDGSKRKGSSHQASMWCVWIGEIDHRARWI